MNPTNVTSWTSGSRDLATGDLSRFRGEDKPSAVIETNLGNGLVQITYVDCPDVGDPHDD